MDRAKLNWLIRRFKQSGSSAEFSQQAFRTWLGTLPTNSAIQYAKFPILQIGHAEREELRDFLSEQEQSIT